MNANITHRLSAACLAALLCCGALTNAVAGEQKGVTVKYGDLNLSNPKGVATLYGRIKRAATVVCGPPLSPLFKRATEECKAEAIANAIREVNNDLLTAMHKEKASRRFG
jgi:UrcA family protein